MVLSAAMQRKVVIVEGLIGGGKSVLAAELGRALGENSLVLLEPDEKNHANPYLADYYADPKRWGFTMQIHLLALRFRMQLQAQWHAMSGAGDAVCDRSYQGDTCFGRMLNRSGVMSDHEYATYCKIYHAMTASVLLPNVCVRILVSPQVANERIQRRMKERNGGRDCESAIDLDYLRALDEEITQMVSVLRSRGVTVLDVPWDVDRDSPEQREVAVTSLAGLIHELRPQDALLDLHRRST
jgi:deoxyadenosine/deoxycytidine kinase